MFATQTNAGASLPASSVQAKYFWLVRMVSWITSRGTSRKSASNRPSSGTGHSVRPGILDHQPFVLDQLQLGIRRGRLGALADQSSRAPPGRR